MNDLADVTNPDLLPPLLQDFERLIGLAATLDLVRARGGLRIFIPTPARVTPEHALAKIIGVEALLELANEFGGEAHFALPKAVKALLAVRNSRICDAYATHKTVRELALEHRLTERQVERIVAAAGVTAPLNRHQGSLF